MSTTHSPYESSDETTSRAIEITFAPAGSRNPPDVVVLHCTPDLGPGGHSVYCDATGIIRAEVSASGEARMLPTSAQQQPARPVRCRFLEPEAESDEQ